MSKQSSTFEFPLAVAALAILFALASVSAGHAAPVDAANAKCRSAIAKGASKLASTAMKAFDTCIKTGIKNGVGSCATIAAVDTKLKIAAAETKLSSAIAGSCNDVTTAVALAEHLLCSPPVGSSIASFADLDTCVRSTTKLNVESLRNALLNPDFPSVDGSLAEACINAIGKNASKLLKTVQKEKTKAIAASDKIGGDSGYNDPGDPSGKIGAAVSKAQAAISAACGALLPGDWGLVRSCAEDPAIVTACVPNKVIDTAAGLTGAMYDEPGICPTSTRLTFHGGAQGGAIVSDTELDWGWTGYFHDMDLTGDSSIRIALACGAPTGNDCTSCNVSAGCEEDNCRCDNDNSLACDEPFGPDFDHCGGDTCRMFFRPPLPIFGSGVGVCATSEMSTDVAGTVNVATGSAAVALSTRTKLHFGATSAEPCPICTAGACDGGARNGLPCTADATSDFGDVSYDCPPTSASNITGSGIPQQFVLSDATTNLPFNLPCDAPLVGYVCACSTCSLDNSIGCNSDAECIGAGAGVCRTDGLHGGASRAPHACDGAETCDAVGGNEGECTGPLSNDMSCDGIVRGNGDGVYYCNTNVDCAAIGPEAGDCTIDQPQRCFLDPVVFAGNATAQGGTLGAAYCASVSSGGAVNSAFGLPGPARISIDTEYTHFCADGVTPWGPGGANCP